MLTRCVGLLYSQRSNGRVRLYNSDNERVEQRTGWPLHDWPQQRLASWPHTIPYQPSIPDSRHSATECFINETWSFQHEWRYPETILNPKNRFDDLWPRAVVNTITQCIIENNVNTLLLLVQVLEQSITPLPHFATFPFRRTESIWDWTSITCVYLER